VKRGRPTLLAYLLLAVAAGPASAALPPAPDVASTSYRYHRGGEYLDWGLRPSLLVAPARAVGTLRLRKGRIEEVAEGRYRYSAADNAWQGLWEYSRWRRTGKRAHLAKAVGYANAVMAGLDRRTGRYLYHFTAVVSPGENGSPDLVLRPPWYGGMTQGVASSLLSRIYRVTGQRRYLRAARLGLEPLRKPFGHGGVRATFLDTPLVFFEGYDEPVKIHTLAHFVDVLVGLYDMSDLSPLARRLFDQGMRTLPVALPRYDLGDRVAVWLAHLTAPTRAVEHQSGYFQEQLLGGLRGLESIRPSPTLHRYLIGWDAQLPAICENPQEYCFFRH
jgi:hypothetical protein